MMFKLEFFPRVFQDCMIYVFMNIIKFSVSMTMDGLICTSRALYRCTLNVTGLLRVGFGDKKVP